MVQVYYNGSLGQSLPHGVLENEQSRIFDYGIGEDIIFNLAAYKATDKIGLLDYKRI